jgi:hypothetical protein
MKLIEEGDFLYKSIALPVDTTSVGCTSASEAIPHFFFVKLNLNKFHPLFVSPEPPVPVVLATEPEIDYEKELLRAREAEHRKNLKAGRERGSVPISRTGARGNIAY